MKAHRFIGLFLLVFLASVQLSRGQDKWDYQLGGYVKFMNTNMFTHPDSLWLIENMVHNRINFRLYAGDHLSTSIEIRNRLIYGDFIESIPGYSGMINTDQGYLNMTDNFIEGESWLLNSAVDRAYVEYNAGNFNVRLGRQRINWGQTFVWNPNDIFNVYSFFDFDYEEKPGADALRVQYYPSYTSVTEMTIKIDENNRITAAGYYRFNKWGQDIQVMGGYLNENDYVAGAGFSGNIKSIGLSGELSYFRSNKNFADTSGTWMASLSANYLWRDISFQAEMLYSGFAKKNAITSIEQYYYQPLTVKNLSFSEWSWFGKLGYPVHPLLNASFAFMFYPGVEAWYFGPNLEYSLQDNFGISLIGQRFAGKFNPQVKEKLNFIFLRFRWSF
ncbi:MAG: DUF1302 family protein [Perlabentimonas sp.]